jgi:hypothetical protein
MFMVLTRLILLSRDSAVTNVGTIRDLEALVLGTLGYRTSGTCAQ